MLRQEGRDFEVGTGPFGAFVSPFLNMTSIQRRQLLSLLASAALPIGLAAQTTKTQGRLVIIGGAEDRKQDRTTSQLSAPRS